MWIGVDVLAVLVGDMRVADWQWLGGTERRIAPQQPHQGLVGQGEAARLATQRGKFKPGSHVLLRRQHQ